MNIIQTTHIESLYAFKYVQINVCLAEKLSKLSTGSESTEMSSVIKGLFSKYMAQSNTITPAFPKFHIQTCSTRLVPVDQ